MKTAMYLMQIGFSLWLMEQKNGTFIKGIKLN